MPQAAFAVVPWKKLRRSGGICSWRFIATWTPVFHEKVERTCDRAFLSLPFMVNMSRRSFLIMTHAAMIIPMIARLAHVMPWIASPFAGSSMAMT